MATFTGLFQKGFSPYRKWVLRLVLLFLFIALSIFLYRQFTESRKTKIFNDVANANTREKIIEIFFFHVDWCAHCKTAMPEWSSFSTEYDGRRLGEYVVKCIPVNCTNDDNPKIARFIQKYKITGYPTVKLMKDDVSVAYDAKINKNSLEQFVKMNTTE